MVPGTPFVADGTLWTRSARSFGCLALVGSEFAVNGNVAILVTWVNVTIRGYAVVVVDVVSLRDPRIVLAPGMYVHMGRCTGCCC